MLRGALMMGSGVSGDRRKSHILTSQVALRTDGLLLNSTKPQVQEQVAWDSCPGRVYNLWRIRRTEHEQIHIHQN